MSTDIILSFEVFDGCMAAFDHALAVLRSLPNVATQSAETSAASFAIRNLLADSYIKDTCINELLYHILAAYNWDADARQLGYGAAIHELADDIDTQILERLLAM